MLDAAMKELAHTLKDETSLMFFARGYNYATALEAALKTKVRSGWGRGTVMQGSGGKEGCTTHVRAPAALEAESPTHPPQRRRICDWTRTSTPNAYVGGRVPRAPRRRCH